MWVQRRFIDDVGASKQLDRWLAWLEFSTHTQTMQAREICIMALALVYGGLAADIELQKKYDWAKYYHNQGDIKLVFTGPAGRLVLDFLEPITPDAACWIGGRTYRADMPQAQPAGLVFEWKEYGNLERCELFGGALVLEVAPALPGAWAARANYMSLGDWTSPGAAKKCLQDWLQEKMKGFNGQAAKLKMLKWDDGPWANNSTLTCKPLPGLVLVIQGKGHPTYKVDVYVTDVMTNTCQEPISQDLDSIINAKSAAQRWWRERIESLYE